MEQRIKDRRPKLLMVDFDPSAEASLTLRYPNIPFEFEAKVDCDFNGEKDAAILAAAISTVIKQHEENGGNGGELLKSVVTQLEDTFIDIDVELKKRRVVVV